MVRDSVQDVLDAIGTADFQGTLNSHWRILTEDEKLLIRLSAIEASSGGGGSGDFLADGSVPMTGDFQIGANKIDSGANNLLLKTGVNCRVQLGDDGGARSLQILNLSNNEVASISSLGGGVFNSLTAKSGLILPSSDAVHMVVRGHTTQTNDIFQVQNSATTSLFSVDGSGRAALASTLTGSEATPALDISAIWDTTGAPTAFKLNATDTASDAASLLADLQVDGATVFSARKDGDWRVYGTWTDASNGDWLSLTKAAGGASTISTVANGTGTAGDLILNAGSGLVGIGKTPSAGYALDVNGLGRCSTFRVSGGFFSGSVLELNDVTSVRFSNYQAAPILFTNGAAATELMRIGPTGKVGINTASPQSLLDVQGAAGAAGILTLSTAELTVEDGDELGRIDFNAPLESSGTDAILVGASIWAEADDTFASDNNTTDLVFATGASEAATEKMRLTSAGALAVAGGLGINGVTPAAQSSHIADVSSGTDAAYETAINAIIDVLEAHGLSATS